jgi:hypothetical protein
MKSWNCPAVMFTADVKKAADVQQFLWGDGSCCWLPRKISGSLGDHDHDCLRLHILEVIKLDVETVKMAPEHQKHWNHIPLNQECSESLEKPPKKMSTCGRLWQYKPTLNRTSTIRLLRTTFRNWNEPALDHTPDKVTQMCHITKVADQVYVD